MNTIKTIQKQFTTQEVQASDCSDLTPEFGRHADVRLLFGLKRGTLYNLLRDGKIRGVKLRVKGSTSGVRLFDLDSIRRYIISQMETSETMPPTDFQGNGNFHSNKHSTH